MSSGVVRRGCWAMTALAPRASRSAIRALLSNAVSPISASKASPSMSGGTPTVSKRCPGKSTKRTRLPSASVSARVLVVRPPLERPMAWLTAAAKQVGRRNGDTVALWVARFNREGLAAVVPRHGGGPPVRYAAEQQRRILAEAERIPDRARDGTATWSLSLLQKALRQAPDGLSRVSTCTIWRTLHAAGQSWQRSRTWCQTGVVARRRKHGTVTVIDPDAAVKRG